MQGRVVRLLDFSLPLHIRLSNDDSLGLRDVLVDVLKLGLHINFGTHCPLETVFSPVLASIRVVALIQEILLLVQIELGNGHDLDSFLQRGLLEGLLEELNGPVLLEPLHADCISEEALLDVLDDILVNGSLLLVVEPGLDGLGQVPSLTLNVFQIILH